MFFARRGAQRHYRDIDRHLHDMTCHRMMLVGYSCIGMERRQQDGRLQMAGKTDVAYITCWTCKQLCQYLNRLQRIPHVPKELWVLMLSEGSESRLLLPDLIDEFVNRVEPPQDAYFLMGLAFKSLFGLFEQLSDLFVRIVQARLSERTCHRDLRWTFTAS